MKKSKTFLVCATLSGSVLFSSCIGSFGLWNSLKDWNQGVSNKFVNELIFLAFHIVPVYEKDLVEPAFYKRYVPERKLTLWQSICQKTTNTMGRLFSKQTQRKPAPKSYIDVNELGTDYWQVILYYGESKYYMIFMR